MKIVSLAVENILSIEKAHLTFSESGLILVEGWNYDAGRANGAGKTAVFDALSFAIYDKVPRKITASEILRRGEKTGHADASILIGASILRVVRSRPKGAQYYLDEVLQHWTQKEFEAKIKLTYTQFIASMYCAQGTESRFLHLNDSEKKNFMLQLLNLDEFSNCKKTADEQAKAFAALVAQDQSKIGAMDSKVDAYSESLIDAIDCKTKIDLLNSQIEIHADEVIEKQKIQKPDMSKYAKFEQDVKKKEALFESTRTKRTMYHSQYRKIASKIISFDGASSCYACGTHLDTTAARASHDKEMQGLENEKNGIKDLIDECDDLLTKENEVSNFAIKLAEKKSKELEQYNSAVKKIAELQGLVKTKSNERDNLVLKLSNNGELANKIKVLAQAMAKLTKTVELNTREIEIYKTVSSMYAPTGAQAYILDSIVESFNESVVKYVDLVWPNVSYKIHSFKETSKGDITAKFSESLTMGGKDISIGSLSGGECKALSLCVDFAILDILEKYFGFALNPIILDEPFDGLDSIGREIVVELLEKLAQDRQIMVVDHASEVRSMFSQVIKVEKRNGISEVSFES